MHVYVLITIGSWPITMGDKNWLMYNVIFFLWLWCLILFHCLWFLGMSQRGFSWNKKNPFSFSPFTALPSAVIEAVGWGRRFVLSLERITVKVCVSLCLISKPWINLCPYWDKEPAFSHSLTHTYTHWLSLSCKLDYASFPEAQMTLLNSDKSEYYEYVWMCLCWAGVCMCVWMQGISK